MAADFDRCRVCGGRSAYTFRLQVLGREVAYFDCPSCGYFQTETPHWLQDAYASAIDDVDTGIMMRNLANARLTIMTLASFGLLKGRVLDHAGGYGLLVRLLRDAGVDALWRDKYCENLLARGFEERPGEPIDLITAFEVFEHLEHPTQELEALLREAPLVLLTTELIPGSPPPPQDWWYLGIEHGQHIGFFRPRTLARMADIVGCKHASYGSSIHLFSKSAIPAYWRTMQKLRRAAPLVSRSVLRSRTVDDHDQLRAARLVLTGDK